MNTNLLLRVKATRLLSLLTCLAVSLFASVNALSQQTQTVYSEDFNYSVGSKPTGWESYGSVGSNGYVFKVVQSGSEKYLECNINQIGSGKYCVVTTNSITLPDADCKLKLKGKTINSTYGKFTVSIRKQTGSSTWSSWTQIGAISSTYLVTGSSSKVEEFDLKDYKNATIQIQFYAQQSTSSASGFKFQLDKIRIEATSNPIPELKVTTHKGATAWYKNGEDVTIGGTYKPSGTLKSFVVQVNGGTAQNVTTNTTEGTWSYTYAGNDVKKANFKFTITNTSDKSKDTTIVVNVDKTAPTLNKFEFSFAQGEDPTKRYQKNATSMLFVRYGYGKLQGNWLFNSDTSGFPVVNAYSYYNNGTTVTKSSSQGISLDTSVPGLYAVSMAATDSAGNTSAYQPTPAKQYYVDGTAPTITDVAFKGTDTAKMYVAKSDGMQWYGATTPSLYAKIGDGDGSGLKSAKYLEVAYDTLTRKFNNLPNTEGLHSGSITATDNVTNQAQSMEYEYRVDLTGPVFEGCEFLTDNPAYMYAIASPYKLVWYNQKDESARITSEGAHDNDGGVGLWKSTIKVGDGPEQDLPATAGQCFYLDRTKEGELHCEISLLDSVSNSTIGNVAYGIDGTKPRILTNYQKHVLYADDYSEAVGETLSGLKSFQYSFDLENWEDYDESKINDLLVVGNVYLKAVDNVGNADTLALYTVDAKNLVTVEGNKVVYALLDAAGMPYFNQYKEAVDDNIYLDRTDIVNLVLPEYITKIGESAFKNDVNLSTLFSFAKVPPTVQSSSFENIAPGACLYVLPDAEQAYEASSWNLFFDDDHILPLLPPNDEIWYISTDGKKIDLAQAKQMFNTQVDEAQSTYVGFGRIKFVSEIDRISRFAFQDNQKLRMLFIPRSIDNIQPYSFQNCKNLEVVTMTKELEEINEYAFDGCEELRMAYIESVGNTSELAEIDAFAFQNCKSLASFTLPASIEYVGSRAFWGCDGMESITLLGTDPEKINMTHETFKGLPKDMSVLVPVNQFLQYEAYNYGKGINFQIKENLYSYSSCSPFFIHHNFIVPEGVVVYGATWNGFNNFEIGNTFAKAGDILEGGKGYVFYYEIPYKPVQLETTSKLPTVSLESELVGTMETVSVKSLHDQGYKIYYTWDGTFEELGREYDSVDLTMCVGFGLFKAGETSPAVKYFDFDNWYNGWVTGVQTPSEPTANSEQPMFNLAGQAVGSDYKGVVIKNGKKYLIRN